MRNFILHFRDFLTDQNYFIDIFFKKKSIQKDIMKISIFYK
jgi:hypothetical protein